MRIGYACLLKGVADTRIKGTIQKNATEERLLEISKYNLNTLIRILKYNADNNIKMFRISSDIIPFGSSPVNKLQWDKILVEEFNELKEIIIKTGIRLSMHPGQYTVINSHKVEVVNRAVEDLVYHNRFLDALQLDASNKIIIHIGGVYGDKANAIKRFSKSYHALDDSIKKRLVIENDDKSYNIEEVLEIGINNQIPVVFDNLHHKVNNCPGNDKYWIELANKTWKKKDGKQKIHYSQQNILKNAGAHSESIDLVEFKEFLDNQIEFDLDIMLEVKDKNLSAIKTINLLNKKENIKVLENEWSRYKYSVLERAPLNYNAIRELLKDKNSYPVVDFYMLIDGALIIKSFKGNELNALEHVWGYFKDSSNLKEKDDIRKSLIRFKDDKISLKAVKNKLYKLAVKYNQEYLLESYYFHI
ncbi:MAG: UV DNA damage repair endonuclease UvsE [Gudongella sp.]|nr:UV DNA damage repair endonuclease UvsE [Gudongella sp.]